VFERAAFAVGLLYLVRMLGLFSILPVFVIAAEFMPGSSPFLLGLTMGIYGFFQSILQMPLGFLSDRVGRRKVIIGALAIFVLGSIVAALADHIYWLILGRSLQGMGAIAGVLLALVSDLTRLEHRSKAMAIVGGCIGISFAVSMLIGPLLYASSGLSGLFFLSAIVGLIGICIVVFFIPASEFKLDLVVSVAGMKKTTMQIPIRPTIALRKNSPESPLEAYSKGPISMETAKEIPIQPPTIAMAFERCSSLVRSETSANRTPAIAPIPCNDRPRINQ
jgi:MFS family permease